MSPVKEPPHDLAILPNWLVWKLTYIEGQPKPRKVPYYVSGAPRHGSQGTDEDRAQLVPYAEARAVVNGSKGYYSGVGFALQPDSGIVALDFDDCVEGGVIAPHVERLCEGTYTELSPSGSGVRSFFKGSLVSRKDVNAERGPFPIEVFGHNGFVTFTGHVTETCSLFGWDEVIEHLTPAVLQMYRDRGWDTHAQAGVASGNPLALLQPTLDISIGEVAETLQRLPRDMGYDDWVKVGMAVHQQTHGEGFELWHNWSKQSPKYVEATGEAFNRERWRSFGGYTGGNHVTFAWVVKLAREADVRSAYAARDEVKARIASCDNEYMLREKLCPEFRRDERLDSLAREALAKVLRAKFKGLGSDYPIAECRKMIAPAQAERTADSDSEKPEWLNGWVWVTEHDRFYHCGRGVFATQQSFNAAYNRHMPRADGAALTVLKSAAATALEDYGVQSVTRAMYLPWANAEGEGLFEFDGVQCVNTFRAASVPQAVSALSVDGCRAVDVIKRHVNMLCSNRAPVVEYVLSMLAYMVQNPGIKVRHAILIKGVEGDGKSLLGTLMSAVMGVSNVKQISPKVLGTDFTDWAHGACLGVLEEIRLAGHNRHDIYNALKPNITNDMIAVHPKGKAEVNVINTMNYLAFTNHTDALPLSDTDRRWFVIFTPFTSVEGKDAALAAICPGGPAAYFDEIHAAMSSQPAELRRWLLDYPVCADFNPNGNAPMTEEKIQMQRASASPEEELVRELIGERGPGIGEDILSSTALIEAAQLADTEVSLQTTTINRILTRLGWVKLQKRVKWKNRLHRVWVRGGYPSSIQDALDATARYPSSLSSEENTGFQSVSNVSEGQPDEVSELIDLF